jgi:acyl-CoA dehydrogenase
MNCSHSCELFIEDLRVPAENVLGAVDEGWTVLLDALNPERLCWAPAATVLGRCAIDHAADYATEREVFDAPIGIHQCTQHPLVKAYAHLEAASQMRKRAAWTFDRGDEAGIETIIAKAVSVEAGIDAVYPAMQTFGGAGYARENHVERWWQEVNLTRLAPVTQQLAYNSIGEHGLGLPRRY